MQSWQVLQDLLLMLQVEDSMFDQQDLPYWRARWH